MAFVFFLLLYMHLALGFLKANSKSVSIQIHVQMLSPFSLALFEMLPSLTPTSFQYCSSSTSITTLLSHQRVGGFEVIDEAKVQLEVIDEAKVQLEATCLGVVSCADIVALTA
ncbi:hypothetical protein DITRI_Ditri04bG0060300 [Diplodiscus trichospermus]